MLDALDAFREGQAKKRGGGTPVVNADDGAADDARPDTAPEPDDLAA
jgi:hypothetical protein